MSGPDREQRHAVAGTMLLVVLMCSLAWLGLRTGQLAAVPDAAPPVQSVRSASVAVRPVEPAPAPEVEPAVVAAFGAHAARLGGAYALAWVDAEGVHLLGASPSDVAWSTIKVPLAIAAVGDDPGDQTWQHASAAITRSDNSAAAALWRGLGAPEEAADAVEEVLAGYGAPEVVLETGDLRPPFSSFGQSLWTVPSQAAFAAALMCAAAESPDGRVRAEMARLVADQQWGVAALAAAHAKGGWGPEPDGAYVLRQLGDVEIAGEAYAVALSARAATGTYAQAAEDVTELVRWWEREVAPSAPGVVCQPG